VRLGGVSMSLYEAVERLGIAYETIYFRVHRDGISHQQAVDHYAAKPAAHD
jgi:hypothetical protein